MSLAPKPPRPGAPSPEDASREGRHQTDELTDACKTVEEELEALKARYEQYFLGIERREPVRWREDAKKKVLRLKAAFTRNTGLRFRIQSLHARFISYERLWMRNAREREEGTYRRDLFKARLRGAEEPAASAAPADPAVPPEVKPAAVAAAQAPIAAPRPTAASPVPPPAASPGAPASAGDPQMRALYDAYVAAKRRCNEDVSKLTYDAVAKSVSNQVPELMARYQAKSVDFRVEVKDGKAVLKAIPRV